MNNVKKIKVVIVGGGFGGVYSAKNLFKFFNKDQIEITLINKTNYFLFTPLLHEVATGGLTPASIVEPIREVFRGESIKIVEDIVNEIDHKSKIVKTPTQSFSYDFLIISTGAETNYFCIPGAQEHAFTLKNLEDAISIRNHIIQTCEEAVKTKNKDLLVTAIVGAGPTGVELAAEFLEYMQHTICSYYKDSGFFKEDIKVNLITTTPDVVSQFPQKMRDLAMIELKKKGINVLTSKVVIKVEQNLLTFKDESTLKAHTVVWVAGVTPTLTEMKGITPGLKGRMTVNEFLQTVDYPNVFSLGDASGTHPMLAQVAVQQGYTVAQNIYSLVNKEELTPFEFEQLGLLISVGQWYAIGNFFGITFRGKIMWWVWRTVYLFNFLSWRKRFEIVSEWTQNLFYPRDITYLK